MSRGELLCLVLSCGIFFTSVAACVGEARAGEQSTEELLKERKCSADADCLKKQEAGTLRKDRSYICLVAYCQLGCRDHAACIKATGNNLARCVSQNCYVPAWMGP